MNFLSPAEAVSNEAARQYQFEFDALGTQCSITFRAQDEGEANAFSKEALAWIRAYEAKFSRFRPDSIVSRINAAAGLDWIRVDADMDRMLDIADVFHQRTLGLLDPTLLPLLRIWNWRSIRLSLPHAADIKAALALTGWHKVERRPGAVRLPKPGMGLDFGYFGKEYAVDQLARLANQRGISSALIDLGRDIFALGGNGMEKSWRVGIEDGERPGECLGQLAVSDTAVSTCGDFARYFVHDGVRFGHIIDPRTGWPVANGMRSVTVVAPSCLNAGMFATAVYIAGRQEGLHYALLGRNIEVCIQSVDGIQGTRNLDRYFVESVRNEPSPAAHPWLSRTSARLAR